MQDCCKRVEEKLLKIQDDQRMTKKEGGSSGDASSATHVPTLINDELAPSCIAVAVSHNQGTFCEHVPFV